MAESGSMGDVIELSELRRLIDEPTVSQEGMPGDHGACECPDCGGDVLTFPPVELLPDDELAARVPAVPLVRDVRRLAAWTGVRLNMSCIIGDACARMPMPAVTLMKRMPHSR